MATTFTAEVRGYEKVVAEYAKVQKEVTKLREEIARMNQATGGTADAHQKASEAGKQHFDVLHQGTKAIGDLALKYGLVTHAMQAVGDMAKYIQAETQNAVDRMKGLVEPSKQLAQIAEGKTPQEKAADLARMEMQADELAIKYGEDRARVRQVIFDARSLEGTAPGIMEAVPDIVKYGDVLGDITKGSAVAGKVPGLFGGAITPRESLSATLAAAAQSPLNYGQLSQILPRIASGVMSVGGTPEEAFAFGSVMPTVYDRPEEAATAVESLLAKASVKGVAGKGAFDTFRKLQAMSPDERKDVLGEEKTLNLAYERIGRLFPTLQTRAQEVGADITATKTGGVNYLENQFRAMYTDTTTEAGRNRANLERLRQEEQLAAVEKERRLGGRGIGQEIGKQRLEAEIGGTAKGYGAKAAAAAAGTFLMTGEAGTETAGRVGAEATPVGLAALWGMGPFGAVTQIWANIEANTARSANTPKIGTSALNAATLAGQQQR